MVREKKKTEKKENDLKKKKVQERKKFGASSGAIKVESLDTVYNAHLQVLEVSASGF